jgi:hypothetical protein
LDLLHRLYRLAGIEHVVVYEPAIFANGRRGNRRLLGFGLAGAAALVWAAWPVARG